MFNKYPREMLEDRSPHPGSQQIPVSDWLRTDVISDLIGPICQLFCVTLIVNCSHVIPGKTRIKNLEHSGAVNHRKKHNWLGGVITLLTSHPQYYTCLVSHKTDSRITTRWFIEELQLYFQP